MSPDTSSPQSPLRIRRSPLARSPMGLRAGVRQMNGRNPSPTYPSSSPGRKRSLTPESSPVQSPALIRFSPNALRANKQMNGTQGSKELDWCPQHPSESVNVAADVLASPASEDGTSQHKSSYTSKYDPRGLASNIASLALEFWHKPAHVDCTKGPITKADLKAKGLDRLVIHPDSRFKVLFEIFIIFCVLYTAVVEPLKVCWALASPPVPYARSRSPPTLPVASTGDLHGELRPFRGRLSRHHLCL